MTTNRRNRTATKTGVKPSRGKLPFFGWQKKSPTSLLELNFIEILHLMTQTRKDDQTN